MRQICQAAVLAVSCTLPVSSALGGQLPQEIVSRYRPAVERIEQAYTGLTVEGVTSVSLPQEDKSRTQRFIMRADGKLRRLDLETVRQHRMGLPIGGKEMRMATTWGSLVTRTEPGHKFFDDAVQLPYDKTVAEIDQGSPLNSPYSITPRTPGLDMLLSPGVDIVSADKVERRGEQLIEIVYRQNGEHVGRSGLWNGRLVLSPSEGWGLRAFILSLGRGSDQIIHRAAIGYSGTQDGVPLVSSIESETLEGNQVQRRHTIQVEEIKIGKPDKYYFDSWTF